ncbi:hypothetical protein CROQUDRAFT_658796 [Cronartium quercuum f. sp. fusiforme G11]|uniref:Uncharacterized protein n=1 Tax=Cronartium quercuum f. sp. fusiforme G11 TaxID=708437 RepID=A0A9P6NKS5_9BASI|nr:hypothetical protein CROQUDRAFT_658796 [Cronartium quercuum f. sp. fusiforme G11]
MTSLILLREPYRVNDSMVRFYPDLYICIPILDAFSTIITHAVYAHSFDNLFPRFRPAFFLFFVVGASSQIGSIVYTTYRIFLRDYTLCDDSRVKVLIFPWIAILVCDLLVMVGWAIQQRKIYVLKKEADEVCLRIPLRFGGWSSLAIFLTLIGIGLLFDHSSGMAYMIFYTPAVPLRVSIFMITMRDQPKSTCEMNEDSHTRPAKLQTTDIPGPCPAPFMTLVNSCNSTPPFSNSFFEAELGTKHQNIKLSKAERVSQWVSHLGRDFIAIESVELQWRT